MWKLAKKNISVNYPRIPTQKTKCLGSWLPLAWKCFGITISETIDMQVINELDVIVYWKFKLPPNMVLIH